EHAPRKSARTRGNRDVSGAFHNFVITIAEQLFLQWIRRKSRVKSGSTRSQQPQSRIFLYIRFRYSHLCAFTYIHHRRQARQELWVDLQQMLRHISALIVREETVLLGIEDYGIRREPK